MARNNLELSRKRILVLTAVVVVAAITWFVLGYIRTGGLIKELIFLPNFHELKTSQCFLDSVCSYDHKVRIVAYAEAQKYTVKLVESVHEKDALGPAGQYVVDTFRIENFHVGEKKYGLYLRYYNDRLNQIAICWPAPNAPLLRDLSETLGLELTEFEKIKKGDFLIEVEKRAAEDCVTMEDARLKSEYTIWRQLVY